MLVVTYLRVDDGEDVDSWSSISFDEVVEFPFGIVSSRWY